MVSCNKVANDSSKTVDSAKIIDSINATISKHNDSIRALNSKNHFDDLSGTHKLTFTNDEGLSFSGTVTFSKIMSDGYDVKGSAKSGKIL
jgi:hypothetical protein